MADAIEKVSIIVSKGSLEGIYPALIMANGARAEGIDANLFFTFFGLDAIHKKRFEHIKVATVGNPGMHMATLVGGLPGMSGIATHMLAFEGDSQVRWFEGNFSDYEEWRHRELGVAADQPHRIKYKPLARS